LAGSYARIWATLLALLADLVLVRVYSVSLPMVLDWSSYTWASFGLAQELQPSDEPYKTTSQVPCSCYHDMCGC
jgi:hypothetical protein